MPFQFDWNISVGNIVTVVVLAGAWLISRAKTEWRVEAMEKWMLQHEALSQRHVEALGKVEKAVSKLLTVADQLEKRLERLERSEDHAA